LTSPTELAELHHLIGGMRKCVTSLSARYGNTPAMRRIVNDAERLQNDLDRLDIDTEELEFAHGVVRQKPTTEKIAIPETQYDTNFWRDAGDEGIGFRD
jgi:hypothetical protein